MDDVFKLWVAKKVLAGSHYYIGQHGNSYGTRWDNVDCIEEITPDKFITWGWKDGSSKHFPAFVINTAAKRRYIELKKINPKIKLKDVKKALRIRNISDTKRKNSPLLKHRDSVEIDTGKLNKQAMLAKMSIYVERVLKAKYGYRARTKKQ